MRRHSGYSLVAAILLVILPSCNQKEEPLKPLDHERFVQVYVAALSMASRRAGTTPDSLRKINLGEVCSRFGTSEKEFWATVDSYRKEPEQWSKFFEQVIERQQKTAMEESKR